MKEVVFTEALVSYQVVLVFVIRCWGRVPRVSQVRVTTIVCVTSNYVCGPLVFGSDGRGLALRSGLVSVVAQSTMSCLPA